MSSALVGVLCAAGLALQAPTGNTQRPPLRVTVNLVLVPVTVTDRAGRLVSGLERDRFQVLEQGVPQRIVSFSSEDVPVSVGLVLDISGSMKEKIAAELVSLQSLFRATGRADEALLLTVASRPSLEAPFTTNFDDLAAGVKTFRPGGRTALIDAVYLALDRVQAATNSRRALVVISDGQDNNSRYSKRELLKKAIESDVPIYTVAVYDPPRHQKAIELREANQGVTLLAELSRETGGLHLAIRSVEEAPRAVERISRAVHEQYILGYYTDTHRGSGWRRIQVKVDVPNVRPYSRRRFFAP